MRSLTPDIILLSIYTCFTCRSAIRMGILAPPGALAPPYENRHRGHLYSAHTCPNPNLILDPSRQLSPITPTDNPNCITLTINPNHNPTRNSVLSNPTLTPNVNPNQRGQMFGRVDGGGNVRSLSNTGANGVKDELVKGS